MIEQADRPKLPKKSEEGRKSDGQTNGAQQRQFNSDNTEVVFNIIPPKHNKETTQEKDKTKRSESSSSSRLNMKFIEAQVDDYKKYETKN